MKDRLFFIICLGVSFYCGMKFKKYKNTTKIQVGKFVIEFDNKNKCSETIIKPKKEEKPKNPIVIPVEPESPKETEIKKNLEPEKVEEKEPEINEYELTENDKISDCWSEFNKDLNAEEISFWSYFDRYYKCRKKEIIYTDCYYFEGDEKSSCELKSKQQAEQDTIDARNYHYRKTEEQKREEEAQEQKEREEKKDLLKEAIKELKYENY